MKIPFYFAVLVLLALPQRANANLLDIALDILSSFLCSLTFNLLCFSAGGLIPDETLPPEPLPPGPWSMTLDVKGSNQGIARQFYENGAARWARIIRGDQPDITDTTNLPAVPFFNEHGCTYPTVIDDLYLCIWDGFIDGPGIPFLANTVAIASPWLRRSGESTTPYVSIAKFDAWDLAGRINDGTFQTIVNHEMGHALGLGTMWIQDGKCPRDATANSLKANQEFQALTGCSSNTWTTLDCGHWDPACFGREFFVPTVSRGAKISRVTVGALEDLGYTVDYSGAGSYTYDDLGAWCKCRTRRGLRLGEESEHEHETSPWDTTDIDTTASTIRNHRSDRTHRQLSDAARDKAVVDGIAFLEAFPDTLALDENGRMLGDSTAKFAVVYVEEEGQIYAVHVEV